MYIIIIILHFAYKMTFLFLSDNFFSAVTSQSWTFSVRKKTRKRVLIQESPRYTKNGLFKVSIVIR